MIKDPFENQSLSLIEQCHILLNTNSGDCSSLNSKSIRNSYLYSPSPEPWWLISQSSLKENDSPKSNKYKYTYVESQNENNANKQSLPLNNKSSPLEKLKSFFNRKKNKNPSQDGSVKTDKDKIDWVKYTDERLPFSGKRRRPRSEFHESTGTSLKSWSWRTSMGRDSSWNGSGDQIDILEIIELEQEPRVLRPKPPEIQPVQKVSKSVQVNFPEKIPEPIIPLLQTNLVTTCFLNTRSQTLKNRRLAAKLRKDREVDRNWSDQFRISKYDHHSAVPVKVPVIKVHKVPKLVKALQIPESESKPMKIPIQKKVDLPSKLPVPIFKMVRQRTFDSGISNNSSPSPMGHRSLSPAFSLRSEPPWSSSSMRVHGRRPAVKLNRTPSLDSKYHETPVRLYTNVRHSKCFACRKNDHPEPIGGRVPPTMLRIENDPKPRFHLSASRL